MPPIHRFQLGFASVLLGATVLTGCSAVTTMEAAMPEATDNSTLNQSAQTSPASVSAEAPPATESENVFEQSTQPSPQLIRTAHLSLTVDAVETSVAAVSAIARQQQGDVLNLQDQTPQNDTSRHIASMQIRVPQAKLEATLAELAKLGTVQQQAIAAEDVSNQLVDYEARLRNLRRAEATVLDIMDRSGGVGDVLKVAQELNNIRSSIEQIDAQLKNLQTRVAYSTINLNLEEAIAVVPPQRAASAQLQESWEGATRSIGKVTVDLLQLGIWLMVYSPYLLLVAGAASLGYLKWRRSTVTRPEPQE